MKTFIKIVLGNLVALILFGFVVVVLFGSMIAVLFTQDEQLRVEKNSVLVFDISANLTDSSRGADFWQTFEDSLGSRSAPSYSLRAVTGAIRSAAEDSRVSSLFIHGSFIPEEYGSGYAALRELRDVLLEFKESGKPLVAYLENPTVRDYYVASAADRIIMNPYGIVGLSGLSSQQIFIAGALERYGVGVQVTRAGRYKAAIEMFTETGMSEANRTQTEELLADIWGEILESVGESRGTSVEDLQRMADGRGFIDPDRALEGGLVDEIGYFDQVLEELRQITDASDSHFAQVDMETYLAQDENSGGSGNRIAVVYVEGDIIDGEGVLGSVGGDRYAREIRRLRQSDDVHALVVRVNSPGGSVSAAETIRREIVLAGEEMPVVVSFGSFAASGGYWIAAESDRIFSQPNTITGSIGVFGILPNLQELANNHGITFESVNTADFADSLSLVRPKTEEELGLIQEMVDEIYQDFLERVAHGRGMSVSEVHELAQGRVWSGQQALRIGLVDEMGGLGDAIAFAAEEADLDSWNVYEFPRPADFSELLEEMLAPERTPLIGRGPVQGLVRELHSEYRALDFLNDPRGVYARLPFSLRIR